MEERGQLREKNGGQMIKHTCHLTVWLRAGLVAESLEEMGFHAVGEERTGELRLIG